MTLAPDIVYGLVGGIIAVLGVVGVSYAYYDFRYGAPTYPTNIAVRQHIITLLAQEQQRRSGGALHILDLGSGSGQLTWHIARALPAAQVTGIEISPIPWLRSVLRQKFFGPKNLQYLRCDFWSYDCRRHDAVITYLLGPLMPRVSQKLWDELPAGALVISNRFPLQSPPWTPPESVDVPFLFKSTLHLYRKPLETINQAQAGL